MLSRSTNPAFTPLGSGTVFGIVFLFRMYVVCHSSSCKRDFRRKPRMHPAQSLLALGTLGLLAMVSVKMMVLLSR